MSLKNISIVFKFCKNNNTQVKIKLLSKIKVQIFAIYSLFSLEKISCERKLFLFKFCLYIWWKCDIKYYFWTIFFKKCMIDIVSKYSFKFNPIELFWNILKIKSDFIKN
jgi:hypothetical protein